MTTPSTAPALQRSRVRRALLYLVPWSWFLIRGAWAPLDVLAIGMPLLGVAALVGGGTVSAIARRRWPLSLGVSIAAVGLAATLLPRLPNASGAPAHPIRIASANVLLGNPLARRGRCRPRRT